MIDDIKIALELAEMELKIMYERSGYTGSNVLAQVQKAQKLVKESDSLPCVSDQRELFDFKDWWNELPDESDDRLFITKGTIERFLKSNSR